MKIVEYLSNLEKEHAELTKQLSGYVGVWRVSVNKDEVSIKKGDNDIFYFSLEEWGKITKLVTELLNKEVK